jgi:hypothetical protein
MYSVHRASSMCKQGASPPATRYGIDTKWRSDYSKFLTTKIVPAAPGLRASYAHKRCNIAAVPLRPSAPRTVAQCTQCGVLQFSAPHFRHSHTSSSSVSPS